MSGKVERLKLQLKEQDKNSKQMWRLQCAQNREQENTIECLQREIEQLKGASARNESPYMAELSPLGPSTGGTTSHQEVPDHDSSAVPAAVTFPHPPPALGEPTCLPPRVVHLASSVTSPATPASSGRAPPVPATHMSGSACSKGKAPPFDTFSGEDPEVRIDDWIPSLQRASIRNGWTEEELNQLAGSLRGYALQEWNLLPDSDRSNVRSGVKSLHTRLESGTKAMAAQDFRHCSQRE